MKQFAFPSETYGEQGMNLRDWFASQALNGFISTGWTSRNDFSNAVKKSYEIADLMIIERTKDYDKDLPKTIKL